MDSQIYQPLAEKIFQLVPRLTSCQKGTIFKRQKKTYKILAKTASIPFSQSMWAWDELNKEAKFLEFSFRSEIDEFLTEILLEDVLEAQFILSKSRNASVYEICSSWQYGKPLSEQSDETGIFLSKLFSVM